MKAGNAKPDVSSRSLFEDDKYMIPTLEDDALLFSLDDISDEQLRVGESNEGKSGSSDPAGRVEELERELSRLRGEFAEYKDMVKKSLEKDLSNGDGEMQGSGSRRFERAEEGYFSSYSYNSMSGYVCSRNWILTVYSYPRDHVEGQDSDGCVSRFHLSEQEPVQGQGCVGCWMRNWYVYFFCGVRYLADCSRHSVHVLRQSRRKDGHCR